MSVVGFDLGNESCVVAVARQRGIDVILNDESKRETPALVCFGDKQRFLGTAGAATIMSNPKNAISQIKRLIGRPFSDPELQQDLKSLPFSVTEGQDGFPLIHAQYLGEKKAFTPTQVMGMIFSNMKTIAEKNLNTAVVDCCIGIPIYFTDLQRRAVMDAATIAGLHPLRLMHETTATALAAYGIYKTDLPENDQLNVAFIKCQFVDLFLIELCVFSVCALELARNLLWKWSLRLLQLAQMRSISKRVNGIISSEVFQNVFNGRIDSLSDIIFFAHGRHVNQVEPFGALWGVRGVMGCREITIPLQPIMRNHVYEGEDIQLLASYGIVFLFKVSSKDTKCIRLLLVNILSSTTTPIPKPDEVLHFTSFRRKHGALPLYIRSVGFRIPLPLLSMSASTAQGREHFSHLQMLMLTRINQEAMNVSDNS
ncbi:heat shock 70 kDa protein 15-like protein [Tanacetum coccineum]